MWLLVLKLVMPTYSLMLSLAFFINRRFTKARFSSLIISIFWWWYLISCLWEYCQWFIIGENQMICSRLMNLAISSLTGGKVSVKSKIEALQFISDCLYENSKYLIDPFLWLFGFLLHSYFCSNIWRNPFLANVPILCPLKASKNQRFSGAFRGYKIRTLVRNRLNLVHSVSGRNRCMCDSSHALFYKRVRS